MGSKSRTPLQCISIGLCFSVKYRTYIANFLKRFKKGEMMTISGHWDIFLLWIRSFRTSLNLENTFWGTDEGNLTTWLLAPPLPPNNPSWKKWFFAESDLVIFCNGKLTGPKAEEPPLYLIAKTENISRSASGSILIIKVFFFSFQSRPPSFEHKNLARMPSLQKPYFLT